MEKVELKILGISSGHTAASYTLILEEVGGSRKLPVVIGAAEAQSIAVQIEGIKPVRPMTHDLLKTMLDSYDLKVNQVVISKLEEGIFYSNLYLSNGSVEKVIDARTSDSIAVALRFKCPIYTHPSIMNEAGIILSEKESQEFAKDYEGEEESDDEEIDEMLESLEQDEDDLGLKTSEELEKMLDQAISEENYGMAAKIRDELQTRN